MEEEVLHKLDDDLKKYFPDFDFKLKDFQNFIRKVNGVKVDCFIRSTHLQ